MAGETIPPFAMKEQTKEEVGCDEKSDAGQEIEGRRSRREEKPSQGGGRTRGRRWWIEFDGLDSGRW